LIQIEDMPGALNVIIVIELLISLKSGAGYSKITGWARIFEGVLGSPVTQRLSSILFRSRGQMPVAAQPAVIYAGERAYFRAIE
jgi:hypothetical protein